MTKIHYKGIPCKAIPFGSEPNAQFWSNGNGPFTAKEIGFVPKPLPETENPQEVTCKSCLRRLTKRGPDAGSLTAKNELFSPSVNPAEDPKCNQP